VYDFGICNGSRTKKRKHFPGATYKEAVKETDPIPGAGDPRHCYQLQRSRLILPLYRPPSAQLAYEFGFHYVEETSLSKLAPRRFYSDAGVESVVNYG